MPRPERTILSLHGLVVTDARANSPLDLGTLRGVDIMVLMRHRH